MGNPYPSTGNVAYRSDETVTTEDFVWTPNYIKRNDVVTTADSVRAERITFLRTQHEDLTAVETTDRLALLVGSTGTTDKPASGWAVQEFQKTLYKDFIPGETWTYIVEDYFDYKTLCNGKLWLQNTEGRNVYALVTENVVVDNEVDTFVLFEGTLVEKSIQPITLLQPVTLPDRLVFHEVTITNNEAEQDAYVITLITGWLGRATYLPVDLPDTYGEGLQ